MDVEFCQRLEEHDSHYWTKIGMVYPQDLTKTHVQTEPVHIPCVCPGKYELPILIVATSQRSGEQYARSLGLLYNYKIVSSVERTQGLRCRGVVITPGYFERAEETLYNNLRTAHAAIRDLHTSGVRIELG